jgi:hypothetical protein
MPEVRAPINWRGDVRGNLRHDIVAAIQLISWKGLGALPESAPSLA